MLEHLFTLDDVSRCVADGYWQISHEPGSPLGSPGLQHSQPLPLSVAEPGPLMERAVQIAGTDGLTLQQLRSVFARLGKERYDRGLAFMRHAGNVTEATERRPNRAGRLQAQVVLYASGCGPDDTGTR